MIVQAAVARLRRLRLCERRRRRRSEIERGRAGFSYGCAVVHETRRFAVVLDIQRRLQGRRPAQRDLRGAIDPARQKAAHIAAIAGIGWAVEPGLYDDLILGHGRERRFACDAVKHCAGRGGYAFCGSETGRMGTPAEFTIIVLVVAVGVGLWTLLDRMVQLQRDVEALKRKLGVSDPPEAR